MPATRVLLPLSVTVLLFPAVIGLVLKLTVVPTGTPDVVDKVIGFAKPFKEVVPNDTLILAGAGQLTIEGLVLLKLKLALFNVGTKTVLPVDKVRALSSYKTVVGVKDKLYSKMFPLIGAASPLPA